MFHGYTEFCVNCILKIHSFFNALSSEYAKAWPTAMAKILMHRESMAIVTKGSK